MYNDFNFISADIILTQVKQELKSYFDSGAVDDILLPQYIDDCLRKFSLLVLQEQQGVVEVTNFKGKLPPDFKKLKIAYLCDSQSTVMTEVGMPTSQSTFTMTTCTNPCTTCTDVCTEFEKVVVRTPLYLYTMTNPRILSVYYGSKDMCIEECRNFQSRSQEEIKINKGNVVANFPEGIMYIEYYSHPSDEYGPLIPEEIHVEEYIIAYIKYKLFEQLWHSISDESQNQVQNKMQFYYQVQRQKFEAANNWLKTWTKQQIKDNIQKNRNSFRKYDIY